MQVFAGRLRAILLLVAAPGFMLRFSELTEEIDFAAVLPFVRARDERPKRRWLCVRLNAKSRGAEGRLLEPLPI